MPGPDDYTRDECEEGISRAYGETTAGRLRAVRRLEREFRLAVLSALPAWARSPFERRIKRAAAEHDRLGRARRTPTGRLYRPWELRRDVPEGEMLPRGYGIAWRDPMSNRRVAYPVPLNLAARGLRRLWYGLAIAAWFGAETRQDLAYARGRREGWRDALVHRPPRLAGLTQDRLTAAESLAAIVEGGLAEPDEDLLEAAIGELLEGAPESGLPPEVQAHLLTIPRERLYEWQRALERRWAERAAAGITGPPDPEGDDAA